MYFDKLLILQTLFVYLSACLFIYLSISLSDRPSPDRQDKPGQAGQVQTCRPSPDRQAKPGQGHAQTGRAQACHALASPNVQRLLIK